jgi:hypothetical protein
MNRLRPYRKRVTDYDGVVGAREIQAHRMGLPTIIASSKIPGVRSIDEERFYPIALHGRLAQWGDLSVMGNARLRVSKREAQQRADLIRRAGWNARVIAVGDGLYVSYVGSNRKEGEQ